MTTKSIVPLSLERIHFEGRGYPGKEASSSVSVSGLNPSGRFIMANLMAFQSLLHQWR